MLPQSQLYAQLLLDPTDGLLYVDDGHGMWCSRGDPVDGLGQPDLGTVQGGQIKPGFAFDVLPDDRLIGHRYLHRFFHDELVDLHQLGGMLNDAGLWVADVALAGKFAQGISDGRPRPVRAVAVDPHLGGQFVGRLEADATDVVGQLVRVVLDLGDGLLSISEAGSEHGVGQ